MTFAVSFGDLTLAHFLARHWQRAPLLVRNAVAAARDLIGHGQLAALAARADVRSRLVTAPRQDPSGTATPWEARVGPFTPAELEALGPAGWTLLVQEVDRLVPPVAALRDAFRFAPNFRIDDVMVSSAVDGGGVGPHLDRYDVFLIQSSGRRRWRIGSTSQEERLVPGLALPILADFTWDQEWILEPGDLLYLPPRIAHEGVAIGPSVTCSVGFRVPDPRELCAGFLRQLPPAAFDAIRYADPDLTPPRHLGEIPVAARRQLRARVAQLLADEARLDDWIGRFATQPLRPPADVAVDGTVEGAIDPTLHRRPDAPRSATELIELLAAGHGLERSAPSHFAWFRDGDGVVHLFVGGESYPLGSDWAARAELLCGRQPLDGTTLRQQLADRRFVGLVLDLLQRRFLLPMADRSRAL